MSAAFVDSTRPALDSVDVSELSAELAELDARPVLLGHGRMREAPGPWLDRRGLCLTLRSSFGRLGQGEASPLPGSSPDTLLDCRRALQSIPWSELRVGSVRDIDDICASIPCPAARFAAETALLSLLASHRSRSVAELLADFVGWPLQQTAELCALIANPLDEAATMAEVAAAWDRGLRCIKVKIGRLGRFDDECAIVERIRAEYGAGLSIRLDVNRAWSRPDAEANLARLVGVGPEYVEEPCASWMQLDAPVPLAADESLLGADDRAVDRLLAHAQVRALVLKPMLLGGVLPCLRLAARARARGVGAVVSHLFDGPIAMRAYVDLALVLGETASLDHHAGLRGWPQVSIPSLRAEHIERVEPDPGERLSIDRVAEQLGDAPFLFFADRVVSYRDIATMVRARSAEQGWFEREVIMADRSLATVTRILRSLAERRPAVLMHPRSTAEQRAQWLALTDRPLADAGIDVVLFTSGSSGHPKGVLIDRRALIASADASAAHLRWFADDRWLCCLPLAHISGLSVLTRCLLAGASMVLMPEGSFDPHELAQTVTTRRVTLLSLVPAMLARLLDIGWTAPAHLRAILVGGSSLPEPMLDQARRAGLPVLATYGMTETCSQIATQHPNSPSPAPFAGHVGPLLPGVEVEERHGRLWVRGPTLCRGYLVADPVEAERAAARFDASGFFDTGDLGFADDAGHLYVRGRADETIITGSENVDPAEVERVLSEFPDIVAACVLGIPDPVWGRLVAAAVVSADDRPLDHSALVEYLRARLPSHQRPRRICRLPWLVREGQLKVSRAEVEDRARGAWQVLSYRRSQ